MAASQNTCIAITFLTALAGMGYLIFSGCNSTPSDTNHIALTGATATFSGSQACRDCHTSEFSDWTRSDHFKAMEPANDSTVLGDFGNTTFKADGITNRFFRKDGKYMVNTQGNDGLSQDYEVKYTFGYYPLQQYLVAFPDGKLQSLRVSWNSRELKWFHQYAGQQLHHHDWLHWTGNGQNWNTMCASCHSTDLKKNYDAENDSYKTTWKDMNVGCESCHGPGSNHIDFVKSKKYASGEKIHNSGFVYASDTISQLQLNTCAPCHARKSDLAPDMIHTAEIMDDLIPEILSAEYYFADGQIREEDYEFGSFAQSKMFNKNVRCANCHNPHSGKLKLEGNNLCRSCHQPEYDSPAHHFHEMNTEASKCVNCHMPQKTYMGADNRRDHSFRIPRPDQSVKFGTPNTCNSCHTNKSAQWASNAIVKWYGPDRTYHFSDDLAPGSLLNEESEMHLRKLLADTSQPAIARATSAHYLGLISTATSAEALIHALSDDKAIVRYHALRSLQNFSPGIWVMSGLVALTDKVRAVRIAAADLYHQIPLESIPGPSRSAFHAADAENKKFLEYQADFPVGNVMLADYELQGGSYANAVKNYLRGLKKDSLMNYARLNLSAAYNSMGQNDEAMKTLQDAVKIDSKNERIYYNIGLLCYEKGDAAGAQKNFQTALQLGSLNPGLYYNYGLLLQELKKTNEAEKILLKGYALNSGSEKINYALAWLYLNQNLPQKARKHALELKAANPENQEYQQVFKALGI